MNTIFIPTNKGVVVAAPEDIIRVEASSNYSKIYFRNGYPLTVAKVLFWFEERLPKEFFYRIHATHIVNRLFVKKVVRKDKVELMNGEQVKVSRNSKGIMQNMMQQIAAA